MPTIAAAAERLTRPDPDSAQRSARALATAPARPSAPPGTSLQARGAHPVPQHVCGRAGTVSRVPQPGRPLPPALAASPPRLAASRSPSAACAPLAAAGPGQLLRSPCGSGPRALPPETPPPVLPPEATPSRGPSLPKPLPYRPSPTQGPLRPSLSKPGQGNGNLLSTLTARVAASRRTHLEVSRPYPAPEAVALTVNETY